MGSRVINDIISFFSSIIFLQLFTKQKIYYELGNKSPLNIVFQVVKQGLRPKIPDSVNDDISELIKNWYVYNILCINLLY